MKHTLLIVDDNDILLKLLKRLFEKNYKVYTASDGVEAMSLLYQGLRPNLIISDLNMNNISGYDLIMHLSTSSIYNKIPVVVLTATPSAFDFKNRIVVAEVVSKPFDPLMLENIVKKAIDYYYNSNPKVKYQILNKLN